MCAAVSTDAGYANLDPADVSVTNLDNNNETAGFTVTPTSGLQTTEAGGTATFTVVLNSQPTADVTITLTSSDLTEGTLSPAQLTFTAANWNAPQTVTVTGVNDATADGNQLYTITTGAAVSTDAGYTELHRSRPGGRQRHQSRQRDRRDHGHPDHRPQTTEAGVHRRARQPADRRCHDHADVLGPHRGHRRAGPADVHRGQLEHAPDGDDHRRQRPDRRR